MARVEVSSTQPELRVAWLLVVVLAGLLVVGAGIGFGASYVGDPPDSTCGSVFYPNVHTRHCERVIPIRLGVTGILLVSGAGTVLLAAIRPRPRRAVSILATASFLVALAVTIANEFVRT
jgi:hypothetical protein